jgi:hypothetical protein
VAWFVADNRAESATDDGRDRGHRGKDPPTVAGGTTRHAQRALSWR